MNSLLILWITCDIVERVSLNIYVGDNKNDAILRKALAIGADRAYRINSEATDSLSVAKHISSFLKKNSFDLILMGKESIDYNL